MPGGFADWLRRPSGERRLQVASGSADRADSFTRRQTLDHLNEPMQRFVRERDMLWIATSDSRGRCDCSFRAGPPGFVQVPDERTLRYPELRGNGVMASLGNITENPHVGLIFIDFTLELIGLHVNGTARLVGDPPNLAVEVAVSRAYVHCRKHIPRMIPVPLSRDWGTDDVRLKGGANFFDVEPCDLEEER